MATSLSGPTKALIAGILLAVLVLAAGLADTQRLERRVREIRAACEDEGRRQANAESVPSSWELDCNPGSLASSTAPDPSGVQGELARAERQRVQGSDWAVPAALIVAVSLSLPWIWYFVLDRIRELRHAIVGK